MKASQTAWVAFSPRVARQGSPGMRRPSEKVTIRIPMRTGIDKTKRRKRNVPIQSLLTRFFLSLEALSPSALVAEGLGDQGNLALRRWRRRWVQEAAEEAAEVIERAGIAFVHLVSSIPRHGPRHYYVVRGQWRAVGELDAIDQFEGPLSYVLVGRPFFRQSSLNVAR